MIIKDFELFQFQLPLRTPLKIANKEILTRDGLIIKITDESNNIGVGEISPLPGLHKENLLQVENQIRKYSSFFIDKKVPNNLNQFDGGFDTWLKDLELFPSVRFGIESAFLSLFASKQRITPTDLFSNSPKKSILINALLSGKQDQILEKVHHYLNEGFSVFKLKVGRNSIEEDIKLVNTLNSFLESKSLLRLDANQAWSLKEALHFFQNINHKNIEYIEEPLKDYDQLEILFNKTNMPIALDENILKISASSFVPPSWIKAIIIKPTVIGSIEKSIQLIRFAENNGMLPVISDTFQSGVGLTMLIS
ncbi:MAG: o-succinylbenzoate synthase, partial [Calditrichia bacterium]|nr:o-succinylbenzoate synthase [Calditrichia bacterium]